MKFILNGIEVSPVNAPEFSLSNDFTGNPRELEFDADKLVLQREALTIIQDWIVAYSPIHGVPLDIETEAGTLNYYVDLMQKPIIRDFECEVSIKRRKGADKFRDDANGTTFELMLKKGVQFDFIDVPYVIVKDNAIEVALSLGVAIYTLTRELIDQTIALSETITNIIDAVTPNTGTGVTFNIGQIATLVIKAALQIAVIALLIVAIVKMSQQFFELIFPKVRYFKACKLKELILKSCQHLNYTLQSTLLDSLSGATILPVPLVKDKDSWWDELQNDLNFAYTKGVPTGQDSTRTLGELISEVEKIYNAKTKVVNGVVQIERWDHWANIAQTAIVPALNVQDKRQGQYTYNTEDVWKRTYIHYQTDPSDLHTMDFFDPTDAEYSTEPTSVPNEDLVCIRGFNDVSISFALGVRKNKLNWLENLAAEFFEVADNIINTLGGNGNYSGQIEARIGVLQVSQQFYSRTKFLWTVNGKQPQNYANYVKASAIYNQYHVINQIANNDYLIFEDVPVRMDSEIFVNLATSNFVEIDGVNCEILKTQFFEEQRTAIITYKQPYDWANGKTTTLTINA